MKYFIPPNSIFLLQEHSSPHLSISYTCPLSIHSATSYYEQSNSALYRLGVAGMLTYFNKKISDISRSLCRCFHVNNIAIFGILLGLLRLDFSFALHISLVSCEGYNNVGISPPLQLLYPGFSPIERVLEVDIVKETYR